jgi:ubiquinone/menaquinone biosynthesis C-methylase UbiE
MSVADSAPVSEYVSDVPYPRNFVPQLAPPGMRLVAALGGFAPPDGDEFAYCELGLGRGDTLSTLAAASPRARFVGVDIAEDHVAFARGLADRGALTNVRVVLGDFADAALAADAGAFDYLAAHGVLSWISPEKRAALFAFAEARLKDGGLLLVSYNALPGWAVMEPLRRVMLDHASKVSGSTLDRARAAYAFACKLAEARAGFFTSHPTAERMLELMRDGGLAYVAHEYFHAHWQAFHFADLAREAAARGLTYAGQMPLWLNVRDLALPPAVKELASDITDRVAFEGLKDFAANELFRTDVFVRSSKAPDPRETRRFFEHTPFGALTLAEHVKRTLRLPIYSLDYTGKVYEAILPHLCRAPVTATDLAKRPDLAGLGRDRIAQVLQNLSLGGQVLPMRPSAPLGSPAAAAYSMPSAFNRRALDDGLAGEGPLTLACPATGGGIGVSLLEAVFLRLLTGVAPADRRAWVEAFAKGKSFPLASGVTKVDSAEDLAALVGKGLDAFRSAMGPKLAQLGVLEPVA